MFDDKVLQQHNVTRDEYALIVKLIGRDPNLTELGIFSAMWSEHCSYKTSKIYLKTLRRGPRTSSRAPARTPASSTSATAWWSSSRSSRTTIRLLLNRFRERRRGWAGYCGIFHDGRAPDRHLGLAAVSGR